MQVRFLFLYVATALIISGGALPLSAIAASPSNILVDVSPENPAPGGEVTITLSSYANDLDSVLISWSVNGKSISSGIGKKSFSMAAPGAGVDARATASITFPDGTIEKSITIRPTVMVLLWQADDSYVPPFYKGKALPTLESEIKVIAMPEIKNGTQMVNSKNMVYAWKKDYTNDQGASGYGRNSYTFVNDYLEDLSAISVTASTTDQKYSSQANIDIGIFEPKILFYRNDPSFGTIWESSLPNGHRIEGEEILVAAPYFISPKDIRLPSLVWNWSINDSSVSRAGTRKNMLPLRAQPGVTGTGRIELEISNTYKLFENAKGGISVEF